MQHLNLVKGDFELSTDRNRMDLAVIHDFLAHQSYWAKNISIEIVQKSIENSLNFGLFQGEKQIGYARVITDYATIAYLGDVFVLPFYRGQGLSKWLMETIMNHADLQGLRRWILLTADAHDLYQQFGWKPIEKPERYMDKWNPNAYTK
jgi:GNAT superfamily N-acetyltransferase